MILVVREAESTSFGRANLMFFFAGVRETETVHGWDGNVQPWRGHDNYGRSEFVQSPQGSTLHPTAKTTSRGDYCEVVEKDFGANE